MKTLPDIILLITILSSLSCNSQSSNPVATQGEARRIFQDYCKAMGVEGQLK